VASELEFPELYPLDPNITASVTLVVGKIPLVQSHPEGIHLESIEITPFEYRLKFDGVAQYYVAHGTKIIIEPEENVSYDLIRLYCLSNAFAALLHQRRIIPLHCAAVLNNDQLVMIFGDSGAGKSTTMAGLIKKGFLPFSDDVCVPERGGDTKWRFYSSYPMMKFWKSTLEMKDLELKPNRKIRSDMDKYGIYFHDQFCLESKNPMAIFMLKKTSDIEHPILSRINGIQLFKELDKNAYRGEYLNASSLKREHFDFFSQLANQVTCFILQRPETGETHEQVTKMISEQLSKLRYD
jgi:hypothetical protein